MIIWHNACVAAMWGEVVIRRGSVVHVCELFLWGHFVYWSWKMIHTSFDVIHMMEFQFQLNMTCDSLHLQGRKGCPNHTELIYSVEHCNYTGILHSTWFIRDLLHEIRSIEMKSGIIILICLGVAAACDLACQHGGVADNACAACTGCAGAWKGKKTLRRLLSFFVDDLPLR